MMRRMMSLGLWVVSVVAMLAWGGVVWGQPVFVSGAGRAVFEKNEETRGKVVAAVREAYAQVKQRLGDRKAKCYVVSDNLATADVVNGELVKVLNDAPYAGLANNWGDYLPIDRDTLAEAATKERGIVITAVCGEVEAEVQMVEGVTKKDVSYDLPKEQWRKAWEEQRPAHAAKGAELVRKFRLGQGQTQVLMVTGTMHTPRQDFVYAGVREVLPKDVILIGGAGADFGTVYFNGKTFGNALYGLRLSGKFRAAATGSKGGKNAKTALEEHLKELTGQLGEAKPTALVYFGCAGWRNNLPTQQRILQAHLPEGVGVYGQYCGGEFGNIKGAGEVVDTDLGVLVLMGK